MRPVTHEELSHERLGDEFFSALSIYDTRRRVETLVDDFLSDDMVTGKLALDVGCGLGFFSARLVQRGAKVIACDIGPGLVQQTRLKAGCDARVADALSLQREFGRERFDLVISSECIEHVPLPNAALQQMIAVLKPGGFLSISTPNRIWLPLVSLATKLRLRPFNGYENFSTWRSLRQVLEAAGVSILREQGLHLFPFQLHLPRLSTWCDRHLQIFRGGMINLCVLGQKQGTRQSDMAISHSR